MLSIKNLTVQLDSNIIVSEFSNNFYEGNMYGFVAVNGSGKTTLFRTIVDLIPANNGKILYDNLNFQNKKKDIFYFENSEWFDKNLSGYDYLIYVKELWESNISIDEMIKLWNMEGYIKKKIKKYSLGMKQKLLISLYLISDAKYFIMDEITNGLDEASRSKFFDILKKQIHTNKKIILISSHYENDISSICDYILSINHSKIEVRKNDIH